MDDWHGDAACIGTFDHRFHGTTDEQEEVKIEYCCGCPVRAECLAVIQVSRERCGLWGGVKHRNRSNRI